MFLGLAIVACEPITDYGKDGNISFDEVWTQYDLTQNYVATCYIPSPNFGSNSANGTFLACFTDEGQDARDKQINNSSVKYYNGDMNVNNAFFTSSSYARWMEGIRYCNVFFKNIPRLEAYKIEADRKRWPAEVRVLRAYYYMQFIKRYGPIPILTEYDSEKEHYKTYNYETFNYEEDFVRPSYYSVVKFIIDECEAALQVDELPWITPIDSEYGRMTKAVAHAMMSQAMLYAASPLWCDEGMEAERWAEAAAITKRSVDELETQGYGLMNKTVTANKWNSTYQEYFMLAPNKAGAQATKDDPETIFSMRSSLNLWKTYAPQAHITNNPAVSTPTSSILNPSQELVDAYETIDGQPVLDLDKPYLDDDHLEPNYNTANTRYNKNDPYKNRDPRLEASIICNGHKYAGKMVETFVGGNSGISVNAIDSTRTGYYLRKWINDASNANSNQDGWFRHLRMAEMYLNAAEAEFYANGATAYAAEMINKTRARAFDFTAYPQAAIAAGAADFELRLRNERRVEFAFEEHRYYDIRRWKIREQFDNIVTGMRITAVLDPIFFTKSYAYDRIVVQERNLVGDKYLKWPIPSSEERRFARLGIEFQNEGW